ncbi:MAG: hypothetical protein ACE366_29275 [Bradymonadia bacterium]
MSSIDQVIARSRQAGAFVERKTFTVARAQAIRKMRQFTLADPHHFVLELIQAALANGATSLNVASSKQFFALSYVGGSFHEAELSQLFDFLFTAKSDLENADLRLLALGINALMLMAPEQIVIESGNGTTQGTTRVVIHGADTLEVGRPEKALSGTYVSAMGLQRSLVEGKSNLMPSDYGERECTAIEERCLALPVPIVVNRELVFGYRSIRTPRIGGYRRTISFDEGDLYGTIGLLVGPGEQEAHFKLLTWGVWAQTVERDVLPGHRIGGVVGFDRLNKTADHAAIVRDARFEEMWARLKPYAQQLLTEDVSSTAYSFTTVMGEPLAVRDLRQLLREHPRVVVAPESGRLGEVHRERAFQIGRHMDALVMCSNDEDIDALRSLAGKPVQIIRPDLRTKDDVAFYAQEQLTPPTRPWLTDAVPLEGEVLTEAVKPLLEQLSDEVDDLQISHGTLYTPEHPMASVGEALVRVVLHERLIWQGRVPCAFPNHVLDVHIDGVAPRAASSRLPGLPEQFEHLAHGLARYITTHCLDEIHRATTRVIGTLSHRAVTPETGLALMILSHIAREGVVSLEAESPGGPPVPTLSLFSAPQTDVLALPLLARLDGEAISLRALMRSMSDHGGLVYGVVPEVPADLTGLDVSDVLSLSLASERLLVALLGPSAYVRLDQREVLATAEQAVLRDVAIGLRSYPPGDFLLETPQAVDDSTQRLGGVEHTLIQGLLSLCRGQSALSHEEENRRQALRHLQWFAIQRGLGLSKGPLWNVERLPLFVARDGTPCCLLHIKALIERTGAVVMYAGRGLEAASLAERLPLTLMLSEDVERPIDGLALNPFVCVALAMHVPVRSAFEHVLASPQEASSNHLVTMDVELPGFEGALGVPEVLPESPAIAILSADHQQTTRLHRVAERFGVVGVLRQTAPQASPDEHALAACAESTLRALLARLDAFRAEDVERWHMSLSHLLSFAERHMQLIVQPDTEWVMLDVYHAVAQLVLSLPLVEMRVGAPVSARDFITRHMAAVRSGGEGRLDALDPKLSPVLKRWIARQVDPGRVVHLASASRQAPEVAHVEAFGVDQDAVETLAHWLERLRPDEVPLFGIQVVSPTHIYMSWSRTILEQGFGWSGPMDAPFAYVVEPDETGERHILYLNRSHWLVGWALSCLSVDEEALAWLLLSSYAFINETLYGVTNTHEMVFQGRLIEAMSGGALLANSTDST